MRPDMSRNYSEQNKKFSAIDGTSVDKKFVAKSFYSEDEATTKSFALTKDFAAKKFRAKKFLPRKTTTDSATTKVIPQFPTGKSALIRTAAGTEKKARVRNYADNRPFLGRGTRQEQLSRQDKPLTIEEVRELLNKDKTDTDDR